MKNVGAAVVAFVLLGSCALEKNQNYELTVLHPETDRGRATMVVNASSRVLGNFTSEAFFGPEDVTLSVQTLGPRTVFEGFENIYHYYGIDGDGNDSRWTLGTPSLSFEVGRDWKVVKIHLRPETNAEPLVLTKADTTALGVLYESNVDGVPWPHFVTPDGLTDWPLGTPDLTSSQRPWRQVQAWKGLEWALVRSKGDREGWAVFPKAQRMEVLWSQPDDGPRVWAQWGEAGFYYLTTWYGEDQKLQWVNPKSGAQTTLGTFSGTSTTLLGPAADGSLYVLHDTSVTVPEGVLSRVEVFRLLTSTHQLEPVNFPEGPGGQAMMVTDFDPASGRLLAVGWPWEGSQVGSFWIVEGSSVVRWPRDGEGPQQVWNARLSNRPRQILAPDNKDVWRRWDLDRLPKAGAKVTAPDDYGTSLRIQEMDDYSVLEAADDSLADGSQVVPVFDADGAQDLRLSGPEGQLGVFLTGPHRGAKE